MPDYLFLVHDDTTTSAPGTWETYLAKLQASGSFQGGSALGTGICARMTGAVPAVTRHLTGFIRITAQSLEDARTLLAGNPAYESGGTVEIRELPAPSDAYRSPAPFSARIACSSGFCAEVSSSGCSRR